MRIRLQPSALVFCLSTLSLVGCATFADEANDEDLSDLDQAAEGTAAPLCSAAQLADIFSGANRTIKLTCSLSFSRHAPGTPNANKVIANTLLLEGTSGSNIVVDCGGGKIAPPSKVALHIRSRLVSSSASGGTWEPIRNVAVRNCVIVGNSRVYGMSESTGGEGYVSSRFDAGHTARAQAAGPRDIRFRKNAFSEFGTAIYFSVGVTKAQVRENTFAAKTDYSAIYLNAESNGAVVADNEFRVDSAREIIAVDGSANNVIRGNRFYLGDSMAGAVYLYRNCGERGMIRHQAPTGNQLIENKVERKYVGFNLPRWIPAPAPFFWLGSRQGVASYCGDDAGFPWGSSADNGDFASDNVVRDNLFWVHMFTPTSGSSADNVAGAIGANYPRNIVSGNRFGQW